MNSTKVALILIGVVTAIPMLACGGCLAIGMVAVGIDEATKTPEQRQTERLQQTLQLENERTKREAQKQLAEKQAKADSERITAEAKALPGINKERLQLILKVVEGDEVAKLWVSSAAVNDAQLIIYVNNVWLLRHEKIQLQDIQNFSKAWLAIIPKAKHDSVSIEIRDTNENKLAAYNSTWGAWVVK